MSGDVKVRAGVATATAEVLPLPKPHKTQSGAGQLAKANAARSKKAAARAARVYELYDEGKKPAQIAQRMLAEWCRPADALPSVERLTDDEYAQMRAKIIDGGF